MVEDDPSKVRPLGLVLGAVAALVFVGGTALSLLNSTARDPEVETDRLSLEELLERSDVAIEGTTVSVERLGDPGDPGVVASIEVREVVIPDSGGGRLPEPVVLFDEGFREDWREGSRVLLFLEEEGGLPGDATVRVVDRCVQEEGALECPYNKDDL